MKQAILELIRFRKIKAWYEKYERLLIPGTLLLGIIFDAITFSRIDTSTAFLLLGIYLAIAGVIILFVSAYDQGYLQWLRYLRLASPLLIQFTFGALLSGVFIFYFFSGSLFVSWPFILALVLIMISNDVFRHYYQMAIVHISVYFFILFSCLSVMLPFLFHSLSPKFFVLAGVASLILIFGYVMLLTFIAPDHRRQRTVFAASIWTIFVVFNAMYFLNVIPPIPLVMREAVVAHKVERAGEGYKLQIEDQALIDRVMPGYVYHKGTNEGVSVYTAIFAPGNLETRVIHHWQRYDEAKQEWVTEDRLAFTISGGRKEGFRGFSTKTSVVNGKWRVDVETERGQVLGRVRFDVEAVTRKVVLREVER